MVMVNASEETSMGQTALIHSETWQVSHSLVWCFATQLTDEERTALVHELYDTIRPHLTRLLCNYEHELLRLGRLRKPNNPPECEDGS
jgi:hypothetical protein